MKRGTKSLTEREKDAIAAAVLELYRSLAGRVASGELVYAPVCSECGRTTRGAA